MGLTAANAWGFVYAYRIWLGLAAVIILTATLVYVCKPDPHKKEVPLQGNIAIANGQNAIIGNLVANQEEQVKNAEINTNKADNALRNSIAKPSNQFNGNGAGDRFCRDFPDDPSCKPR